MIEQLLTCSAASSVDTQIGGGGGFRVDQRCAPTETSVDDANAEQTEFFKTKLKNEDVCFGSASGASNVAREINKTQCPKFSPAPSCPLAAPKSRGV